MYLLLFNLKKMVIKSILSTHLIDIDCSITNNPPCIVCEHLIWLPIAGLCLEWGFLELYRVNNNRALFKVRLPIKIQIMPRPGLGKLLTLTEYSSGLTYFTCSGCFKTVLRSSPPWLADPFYYSSIWYLLILSACDCYWSAVWWLLYYKKKFHFNRCNQRRLFR